MGKPHHCLAETQCFTVLLTDCKLNLFYHTLTFRFSKYKGPSSTEARFLRGNLLSLWGCQEFHVVLQSLLGQGNSTVKLWPTASATAVDYVDTT